MTEPGFEYISINDADEDQKGFNIPFQFQFLFLSGPVKPFFSIGYNYTDVWTSKTIGGHDIVAGFSNNSISLEASVSFAMTNSLSLDPFVTYYFALSPEVYGKVDGDGGSVDLDHYRKLRIGARFFYTIAHNFDLGFGGAFLMGSIKPKQADDSEDFKGFQLNIALRKSFDL